ncbi:MAG: ABC transporter permease [Vicinamibacterales bacterium]
MREDLKAAIRALRASKTFTIVALVVLTLGIGASTAVFSVVDAVVLRGLPFDEHDRLVAVGERRPPNPDFPRPNADPDSVSSIAPQNYVDWAAQQQVFSAMAAIAGGAFTLQEPGAEPEELRVQRVTAPFFDVLRTYPALGAPFTGDNEVEGQHRVAVLSDGLWRRRFGADPDIVGRTIPIEGGGYQVVGVMPPGFEYPIGAARATELWVPYVVPPDERVRDPRRRSVYLQAIARLKPGVTMAAAQANVDQIALALQAAHPDWNKDSLIGVRPLRDHIVGARTQQWMLLLLGAVGLVLLIACANVANLLLARATGREREVGIRAAMGAGRWRLIRQFLVESVVLSAIGTALAVALAWWAVQVLKAAMPEGVPRLATIALDLRVLGAAAGLALLTGLLFGLVPALQLSRPDLTHALKEGARGASTGGAARRLRHVLVVAEVAIAVILVVGATLFIGSFRVLMRIDPGFDPARVLTAAISPRFEPTAPNQTPRDYTREMDEIVGRVAGLPGVAAASAISGGMPMGGSMSITTVSIPGRELDRSDRGVSIRQVTADYHRAIGIPLRAGRLFTATDRAGSQPVVILNESAARKYFPDEEAVGRTIGINGDRTIVGVVGDVYQSNLETEPRTEAYVPIGQGPTFFSELVVKTTGDPYDVLPAVRSAVLSVLPDVPLRNVRTMEEVLARQVAQRRFNMLLLGLFGVLGLVIAAAGIYGVMAYTVSQREREIGVRMALGATRRSVVGMVLGQASLLVAGGLVIGGVGAFLLGDQVQRFLFRMDTGDWRVFATAIGVLALSALVASLLPARRAAGVDPMIALRNE